MTCSETWKRTWNLNFKLQGLKKNLQKILPNFTKMLKSKELLSNFLKDLTNYFFYGVQIRYNSSRLCKKFKLLIQDSSKLTLFLEGTALILFILNVSHIIYKIRRDYF